MPKIPQLLKQRVAQHLGYSRPRGVQPTLLRIFNRSCDSMLSNADIFGRTGQSVIILVERCDQAFLATDFTDESAFSQFQQILGDVNRRTRTVTLEDMVSKARELYLIECDNLAKFINVPNLQRKEVAAQWHGSLGDTYMEVAPNVPDTCVSDRLYLSEEFV